MFGVEFFIKAMEALESKALHVRPLQCSRLRHQLSKCQLCSTYCPTKAISWGESLDIDADKCTDCGICANVCPNGVFEANKPSTEALLEEIAGGLQHSDQIVFACSQYQQEIDASSMKSNNILTVPCLGRIDESVLVGCVSIGAESVLLVDTLCRGCDQKSGWDIAQQTATTANKILNMLGISTKICFTTALPEWDIQKDKTTSTQTSEPGNKHYSRRDFFRAMTQKTKKVTILAASNIVKEDDDDGKAEIRKSGLPFYLPQKRKLLLDSIKRLKQPVGSTVSVDNLPFYQFKIEDSCTGCGMCVYFCPTGALRKTEEDGKVVITFQFSSCTKCNLCQEMCYKSAIAVLPDINLGKLVSDEKAVLFVATINSTIPKEPSETSQP